LKDAPNGLAIVYCPIGQGVFGKLNKIDGKSCVTNYKMAASPVNYLEVVDTLRTLIGKSRDNTTKGLVQKV